MAIFSVAMFVGRSFSVRQYADMTAEEGDMLCFSHVGIE